MRKNHKKVTAVILSAAVAAAACAPSYAFAADKEEVVYVNADAAGNVSNLTVSDHLVNTLKLNMLQDASDLQDIVNVKGEETFETSEDGTILWNAGGNDIYYQGTGSGELPVGLMVSYYLDGERITPKELAGRSGRVTIRMDYENRLLAEGQKVPFAAVGGMILPHDKFSDIEVTNGRILDDGKNSIAAGIAFPGLEEILFPDGRSEELSDLKIPDHIEVSMNVDGFELSGTMHAFSSSLSEILELDGMDKEEDLKDKIEQIRDASDELTQGSADLLEGMSELKEKSGDFADGVTSLNDGISALEAGAASLQSGAFALKSGGAEVKKGAVSLGSGLNQLKSGAAELRKGMNKLYANSSTIDDGSGKILGALDQINTTLQAVSFNTDQLDTLVTGSQSAQQGIAQLAAGLVLMQTQMGAEGAVGQLKTQNAAAAEELAGLQQEIADAAAGGEALMLAANALASQYEGDNPAVGALMQQANGFAGASREAAGKLDEKCGDLIKLLQGNNAAFAQLGTSVDTLSGGAAVLLANYEKLNEGIGQLPVLVNGILQQMTVLQTNIKLLDENYAEFDKGIDAYLEGYGEIVNGYKTLYRGINSAAGGAGELAGGSSQLYQGLTELTSGADTLNEGVGELGAGGEALSEGTTQMIEGIDALAEGSGTLSEGMETFDSEAVKEVTGKLEDTLGGFLDRAREAADGADSYQIFTRLADGQTGKVTFLIETAEIR